MAGLLYKDFVAIRGKIYVICLAAVLLLGFAARILTRDDGIEYLLVMFMIILIGSMYGLVANKIETDLIHVDEAKKQKQYCISLPVNKKMYVAAKYVFMLVVFYVVQSFLALFCSILVINCRTTVCMNIVSIVMGMLPIITTLMMGISAVELPFFIGVGYKKGTLLKQGLLVGFFVLFIVYLLFGDLKIFQNFSLDVFITWIESHQDVLNALHVFTPVMGLLVYYISYRISCFLYERRELSDD